MVLRYYIYINIRGKISSRLTLCLSTLLRDSNGWSLTISILNLGPDLNLRIGDKRWCNPACKFKTGHLSLS